MAQYGSQDDWMSKTLLKHYLASVIQVRASQGIGLQPTVSGMCFVSYTRALQRVTRVGPAAHAYRIVLCPGTSVVPPHGMSAYFTARLAVTAAPPTTRASALAVKCAAALQYALKQQHAVAPMFATLAGTLAWPSAYYLPTICSFVTRLLLQLLLHLSVSNCRRANTC
jgi:hypothetical protein